MTAPEIVTVQLQPHEADAVVYAIALETTIDAENLGQAELSTLPGHLVKIQGHCQRIARLAAVAEQLKWRAHWAKITGEPLAITATGDVLLELSAAAHRHAPQDEDQHELAAESFHAAARTIARAFADAEAVTA